MIKPGTSFLLFLQLLVVVNLSIASESIQPIFIGGSSNYPPYEFLDENGRPTGYNIELTQAIAEIMGMDIEIDLGGWAHTRTELEEGSVDAIMGIGFSAERAQVLDFSPPTTLFSFRSLPTARRRGLIRCRTCRTGIWLYNTGGSCTTI